MENKLKLILTESHSEIDSDTHSALSENRKTTQKSPSGQNKTDEWSVCVEPPKEDNLAQPTRSNDSKISGVGNSARIAMRRKSLKNTFRLSAIISQTLSSIVTENKFEEEPLPVADEPFARLIEEDDDCGSIDDCANKTTFHAGTFQHRTPKEFQSSEIKDKWEEVMQKNITDDKIIRALVQEGIPNEIRGIVWKFLSSIPKQDKYGFLHVTNNHTKKMAQKGEYAKLLLLGESKHQSEILRDMARTFPNHPLFKTEEGQKKLCDVIVAYSHFDPEVGYCQGIPFIVGSLLMQLPEEDSFIMLTYLMHIVNLRELFLPVMEPLLITLYQFTRLIYDRYPAIYNRLKEFEIKVSMFASQWFLTLFASQFHLNLVFRVIDLLLVEGSTFLLRMSLSLLESRQEEILNMKDFEDLLAYLKYGLPNSVQTETAKKVKKLEDKEETAKLCDEDNSEILEAKPLSSQKKLPVLRVCSITGLHEVVKDVRFTKIVNDNSYTDGISESIIDLIEMACNSYISNNMLDMLTTEYYFLKENSSNVARKKSLRRRLNSAKENLKMQKNDTHHMQNELLKTYEGFNASQKETTEALNSEYQTEVSRLQIVIQTIEKEHEAKMQAIRDDYEQELEVARLEYSEEVNRIGTECKELVALVGNECKEIVEDNDCEVKLKIQDFESLLTKNQEEHEKYMKELERKSAEMLAEQQKEINILKHKREDIEAEQEAELQAINKKHDGEVAFLISKKTSVDKAIQKWMEMNNKQQSKLMNVVNELSDLKKEVSKERTRQQQENKMASAEHEKELDTLNKSLQEKMDAIETLTSEIEILTQKAEALREEKGENTGVFAYLRRMTS